MNIRKISYKAFFHWLYFKPIGIPCFETLEQFIKTATTQDCLMDEAGNDLSVEVLTHEIFPLLDSDIEADFNIGPVNGNDCEVNFVTPSGLKVECNVNDEFNLFESMTTVKPSNLKLTYKEFFQWYFGVPVGHPMDAPIYRHGAALQLSKEGMNFQNSLDAFKYECETQDDFLVESSDGLDNLDIQVCIDEIYPVLDSDVEVDIEIKGDTYCFTLPSGRRLEMCCANGDYSSDWRDRCPTQWKPQH